jgi:integrase
LRLRASGTAPSIGQSSHHRLFDIFSGRKKVAKSTQNQAFNALLFYYRNVIEKEVGTIADAVQSRRGRRLPTVLTHSEAMALIEKLQGEIQLMVKII